MNSSYEKALRIRGATTLKEISENVFPMQTLLPPMKGKKLKG
jgi:hypothetical protein